MEAGSFRSNRRVAMPKMLFRLGRRLLLELHQKLFTKSMTSYRDGKNLILLYLNDGESTTLKLSLYKRI